MNIMQPFLCLLVSQKIGLNVIGMETFYLFYEILVESKVRLFEPAGSKLELLMPKIISGYSASKR